MPKGIQKRTIATFNILATLLACMVTKRLNISPGKAMFNWLYSIGSQQPKWFLGSLQNRSRFGARIAFMARGLADPDFLLKFQSTTDVWERSRMVGERISAIRKQFAQLNEAEKEELGRISEAEFQGRHLHAGQGQATADVADSDYRSTNSRITCDPATTTNSLLFS